MALWAHLACSRVQVVLAHIERGVVVVLLVSVSQLLIVETPGRISLTGMFDGNRPCLPRGKSVIDSASNYGRLRDLHI
jgi:hypothetical protein